MALIMSAQLARFIFSFRDKQPKAGKTFRMSSITWTNTVLSKLWSQILNSGEIWLHLAQTSWSRKACFLVSCGNWLLQAHQAALAASLIYSPGGVLPYISHFALSDFTAWGHGQILSSTLAIFTLNLIKNLPQESICRSNAQFVTIAGSKSGAPNTQRGRRGSLLSVHRFAEESVISRTRCCRADGRKLKEAAT